PGRHGVRRRSVEPGGSPGALHPDRRGPLGHAAVARHHRRADHGLDRLARPRLGPGHDRRRGAVILDVDTTSAVPPYEQMRAQITALITTGALAVGDRLPSIRQLAGDLGLAPGTVARAYREL